MDAALVPVTTIELPAWRTVPDGYGQRQPSHLAAVWQVDDRALFVKWMEMRDAWLAAPKGRGSTNSQATLAVYKRATLLWLEYIAGQSLYPWEVTTEQARGWMSWMQAAGLSDATVGQRLAAVSSWYSFVISEKRLYDGMERCLFEDARGVPRDNPFRTNQFKRPVVNPFDKAHLLSIEDLRQLFAYLLGRANTVAGARNYALLLAHATIGVRSSEFCRLTWGDIEPAWQQPGAYIFRWTGKGGKRELTTLPEPVYHAITAYLSKAGRYVAGRPDLSLKPGEYIFPPLRTEMLANLAHTRADHDYAAGHISSKNVQRIFKTALRNAGIANWDRYRVHDVRHTLAVMLHANGSDVHYIKELLHHSSLSTTEIYLRHLHERSIRDQHSGQVMQQLGLPLVVTA